MNVCVHVCQPQADTELNASLIIAGSSTTFLPLFTMTDQLIMTNIIHIIRRRTPDFLSRLFFLLFSSSISLSLMPGRPLSDALSLSYYSNHVLANLISLMETCPSVCLPTAAFEGLLSLYLSVRLPFFLSNPARPEGTLTLSDKSRMSEMLGFVSICFIFSAALI